MATVVGKNTKGGLAKQGKNTRKTSYTDNTGTIVPGSRDSLPAARGDDFAPIYEASGMGFGETASGSESLPGETTEQKKQRIGGATFSFAGGAPTVMSNANKIERVVPLLDSKANSLTAPGLGGASFTNTGTDDGTTGDGTGEQTFDELLGISDPNKKKKKQNEGLDPYTQAQMALLEKMQASSDLATRQSLNTIKNKFNQREEAQRRANESGLASIKNVLNLGGSSRYAPISSQGIISAAEQAGITALSNLDAEEQQLIGEVKAAQADKNYELLEKKLSTLETVRKEKSATASKLQETIQKQEYQSSRDDAIAGLISQGVTSPIEMLNYLNYDESGKKIGDFTLAEITGSLKGLNDIGGVGVGGFKLENKQIGQLLGAGLTGDDIKAMQSDLASGASLDDIIGGFDSETQGLVKKAFGIEAPTNGKITIGKGAKSETEEAFIRTRLFSKVAPILNKGSLSDSDREIIDGRIEEFRVAGFGEQEILDTLAGLPPEVNTPYNGTFRDIIVGNSETMEKQTSNMGRLSQQLSSGNYQGAMNTVEGLAMNEAKKLDQDGYMGTNTAQNYLKKGENLYNLLSDAEDIIGPLQGTWESAKGKLAKSKSKRATEISSAITLLVAEMRNDLSGTAVTDSESTFLEPLIPSLSDTMDNFKVKTRSLNQNTLDRLNSTRGTVSLPEVTQDQVIDPKKRLVLYSNDIYYKPDGQLDI